MESFFVFSGKCTLGVLHLQSTVAAYKITPCFHLEIQEHGDDYCSCVFTVSAPGRRNTPECHGIGGSKLTLRRHEEVILSVSRLLMNRTAFSNLCPHLISSCFSRDPGNDRWKSQLLRVLSKRSLCPDKAAQVLFAKGIAHRTCYLETDSVIVYNHLTKLFKNISCTSGSGEIVHHLRPSVALAKALGPFPSTHMAAHSHL